MRQIILILITLTTHINVSYASFPVRKPEEVPDNMPWYLQILIGFIFATLFAILYYFYKKYKSYNLIEDNKIRARKKTKFHIAIALIVLGFLILGMSAMSMN